MKPSFLQINIFCCLNYYFLSYGVSFNGKDVLKLLSKATDLLLLLFTVCSSKMLWLSIFLGYSTVSWDSVFNYNYQNVSYMSAYAVGIGIYKLFNKRKL